MPCPPAVRLPARRNCGRILSPPAGLRLLKAKTQTGTATAADDCRERGCAEDDGGREKLNAPEARRKIGAAHKRRGAIPLTAATREAGEDVAEDMTKAEASKKIERFGRGRPVASTLPGRDRRLRTA